MTNEKIMSTICDSICRHPYRVESQAELDILCEDCVVNKLKASDGDLISRADAIEACLAKAKRQHGVLYPEDIDNILDSLPSASTEAKPTVIRSKTLMPTKDFKEWAKRIREENPNAIIIPCDAEVVSADATCATCADRALCIMSAPDGNWKACKDYKPSAETDMSEYCDRLWKIAYERGKDEAVQGWIPCSERLPSESGRYLVTYLVLQRHIWVDVMHFGEPSMPNIKVKGMCWYVADDEWGDVVYDDILAWMPLPKTYEGGEDE